MKNNKFKKYFVAYFYTDKNSSSGIGDCIIATELELSEQLFNFIKESLKKEYNYNFVSVRQIIKLKR